MELNFDTSSSATTSTTAASSSCPLLAQQLQMHFQTQPQIQLLEPIMMSAVATNSHDTCITSINSAALNTTTITNCSSVSSSNNNMTESQIIPNTFEFMLPMPLPFSITTSSNSNSNGNSSNGTSKSTNNCKINGDVDFINGYLTNGTTCPEFLLPLAAEVVKCEKGQESAALVGSLAEHDISPVVPMKKPAIVKLEPPEKILDNVELTIKAVGSYCEEESPNSIDTTSTSCSINGNGSSNFSTSTTTKNNTKTSSPCPFLTPAENYTANGRKSSSNSSNCSSSTISDNSSNANASCSKNASSAESSSKTNGNSDIKSQLNIGSKNSAFLPYRPITILTNLQRGNVKTLNKEIITQPLTLHEKAARGDLTIEDLNGIDLNQKDSKGRTMLIWASFHSRLPTVQMLIEKGSDVNCFTPKGETALMFAATNGNTEVLNYLLSNGAETELEDENGNTAIFYATLANHSPSITVLLKNGASMMKQNCNDDSSLSLAISKNLNAAQYAMESYLREYLETNFVIKQESS